MQLGRSQSPRPETPVRIPEYIPIFPLPNVVFFPRTYLPLHIFEPRYREMVMDAEGGGRCIGMVLLKDGWEQDYYGNPPIFEIGCVGRLVGVEPLPDGRSNILLQGLSRFEVVEQHAERSYRQARIVLKPTPETDALAPGVRAELVSLLGKYLGATENARFWREWVRPDMSDEILINNVSNSLDVTPLEKQFLLEADTLQQRACRLIDLIQFEICEQQGIQGQD